MDMVMIFLALFFIFTAAFSYLAYKTYQKNMWRQVGWIIWGILGFSMFLFGFLSGNIVKEVIGLALTFAVISLFFTYYIKSELKVKRFLEAIFGVTSLGIIVYGYFITGSLILEIVTLFVIVMMLIAFILSYLLPKIHTKAKNKMK
ncbi:MAG TPA: hypothetical protein ENG81_03855 [Candidatus Bathyarchaeota archaeon]|nr:hypothetical protein [Candidatus Bathyarchaeota archaeon]